MANIQKNGGRNLSPLAKNTKAQTIVALYASVSAVVGASPIPYADMPALASMQVKMTYDIGQIYCVDLDWDDALLITTTIGAGSFGLREVFRQGVKFVPFAGWALAASLAAAGTEAFGQLAIAYFEERYT